VVQGRATGFLENVTVVEAVLKSSRPVAQTVTAPATPDTTRQQPPATTAVTKGDTSAKQQATAARVFTTSKAQIKFFSSGPAEDIEADNNQAVAKLAESGEVSFAVLIKGFRFDNELMQEHFNGEEYLNSSRFPKATFSGKITDPAAVNFGKDGTYPVTVKGTLQIKGISKPLTAAGTVTVKGKKVTSESKFKVKFTDFQVKTWDKDANEVEITVTAAYN
jgi:polyisoprenoid-binding protein YceI